MNLVGKVFTVLIFVMSLVFMSFAVAVYATHKNWKEVVDNPKAAPGKPKGLQFRLQEEEAENQNLREKRDNAIRELQNEKEARLQAVTKLERERDQLADELKSKQEELHRLKTEERRAVGEIAATHNLLEKLRQENLTLRDSIDRTEQERDKYFKDVVTLTDKLHQAVIERERLKAQNKTLGEDHARALQVLRKFGLKPFPEIYEGQPIEVEGLVLAAPRGTSVEISVGSDDGLLKGHQLEVYRIESGAFTYVGRIEVVKTGYDRAVCKIDRSHLRKPIQRGDRVVTKRER